MSKLDKIIAKMIDNPKGIHFDDACYVCDFYFGHPRQNNSSHRIYKTPWSGDPRINLQNEKGMAKAYQIKQILRAIKMLNP